jgi:hypothetical protein
MTDCMLSEERIEALADAISQCAYSDQIPDIIRRFFAPPPGSVKVEVAVVVCGKEMAAVANDVGDREKAMREARDCIFTTELTHECYATIYVPAVPRVPTIEAIQ